MGVFFFFFFEDDFHLRFFISFEITRIFPFFFYELPILFCLHWALQVFCIILEFL